MDPDGRWLNFCSNITHVRRSKETRRLLVLKVLRHNTIGVGRSLGVDSTGGQNGFHIIVRRLAQGVFRIFRLCSGMLTRSSGILTLNSD